MKNLPSFCKVSKSLSPLAFIFSLVSALPSFGAETAEQITNRVFALGEDEKFSEVLDCLQDVPSFYRSDYHFAYFQAVGLFGTHQSAMAKYWAATCLKWMKSDGESTEKQIKISTAMATLEEREAKSRPPIVQILPGPPIVPNPSGPPGVRSPGSGGSSTQYVISAEMLRIAFPELQKKVDPALLNQIDSETRAKLEALIPEKKFDFSDFSNLQNPVLPKLDAEALKKLQIENRGGSGFPTK